LSRISLAILAAALWLAASFTAHAAGLGRITVLSPLGQPLNAEIELVSLQPGEEDQLTARLASSDAFRQAGIDPSPALSGVRFTVVKRDGRSVIRVTTPQPVNEPFLDLLVELEWTGGRLVREYTLLLDPPEYKGPQAIAAAPAVKPAVPEAPVAQPLPPVESKPEAKPAAPAAEASPITAAPAPEERPAPEQAPAEKAPVEKAPVEKAAEKTFEVKRGDTLGGIARANLPPGVTLNQMLIAIYRANPDAFIRENINLVRAGRILNIPSEDSLSGVNVQEANRLVQAHRGEWEEYRSRLAAQPAKADAAQGQRAVTGKIEAKPEAPAPGTTPDQLRLSKVDPAKPAAPESRAARTDDAVARERALKEAQSRVTDLEKNVADLQKLLELKNQQLAELEKKAGAKPAPAVPAPVPVPAPAAKAPEKPEAKVPAKPEAPKPAPAPEAAKPAPAPEAAKPAPAPAPEAKKAEPSPEAKKAEPAKPKPKAAPPPPPPPSLLDEFLDNPIALAGLGAVLLLLVGYGIWAWRRKKATHAKFQDSVLGAAGGGPVFGAPGGAGDAAVGGPGASQVSVNQPVAGMEAEEVDPIAEADVYMAYGRDAQAEEILKEALQKDPNRIPVHAKLLEIYAKRGDAKALEQTALKLKNLTHGAGPEWDKAVALGRSIDPGNGLYGGGGGGGAMAAAAAAGAAAGAAAAPTLDFDLGGATTPGSGTPDITLDEQPRAGSAGSVDFDLGASTSPGEKEKTDFTPEGTLIMDKESDATASGLDFDLNIGGTEERKPAAAPAAAPAPEPSGGLDFDLNLDLGGEKAPEPEKSAPSMDLSSISLDLGSAGEPSAGAASSNDPKWQEVATKLDLAKAYEEMGDRDGARELLGEVMKDGDAAQKGQAQQLLTKLG
jgi:pilus assembly protein FimV